MDIRQLRYFIAIAEEGSLSSAAVRLGVAQPSLSQHVIRLEEELGTQLLERSARGVALTEAGSLLLSHARDISARLETAREVVRAMGTEPRGPVAIGLPPSISMVLSVPLAETVRVAMPDVQLRASEAMSGYIKQWLQDETVDLALLYDAEGLANRSARHLLDERLSLFAAPDAWPLPTPPGAPVALADLAGLELILPARHHGLRKTLDRHARAQGLDLVPVIEMDAMTQIKELVMRGSGYTILSPAAAGDRVARGDLTEAPIAGIVRPIYLVRNLARPQSRACREVEQVVVTVIRDLVDRNLWQGVQFAADIGTELGA